MATKRIYRANNTYLIEGNSKDNPKLFAQVLSDGRESLYLEYYMGYTEAVSKNGNIYKKAHRESERLGLFLWHAPRTPEERVHNTNTLNNAKQRLHIRQSLMLEKEKGFKLLKLQDIDFLTYFEAYIDSYTKKDKRMIKISLSRFRDFLKETEEYSIYEERITPKQITAEMMLTFAEYLQSRSVGEGAKTIFERFKKVYKSCGVKYGFDFHQPFTDGDGKTISIRVDTNRLRKDILSFDEIAQLAATHYGNENTNIRRAFLFCLYTGLRFCDVKDLHYSNVDFANRLLSFEQNKTKGHSANSGVVIPLDDTHFKLIGEPTEPNNRGEVVFNLPTYEMCSKALKRWVKRAGINKHITWHCARHSFAVNILNNGANIKTLASLLGHSGLKNTEKYTRAVDSLKLRAIASLPALNID